MAFAYMHIFSDFLCFDMSLLLLTVTLRGISNKHCLLSLFSCNFMAMSIYSVRAHSIISVGSAEFDSVTGFSHNRSFAQISA